MPEISSEIYIDGKRVNYTKGTLQAQGNNTATQLTFTIPGDAVTYRKYWNKEVTFFFSKTDSTPMFRGNITNAQINENFSVTFSALDVLGFLTGIDRAAVTLDESNNLDGLSIGGALTRMITLAKLDDKVGTDFVGDTSPIKLMPKQRGRVMILDTIVNQLSGIFNIDNTSLPRRNFIKVIDDGTKGQLALELEVDIDSASPIFTFDYTTNIIGFSVQNRKIPTVITIEGTNASATFKHTSAASAVGGYSLTASRKDLTSRADCMDFAQKVFNANQKAKYEYTLTTFEGAYLEENDAVEIIDKDTEVNGIFRVIGKSINFGDGIYSVTLNINNQPPLLDSFLT